MLLLERKISAIYNESTTYGHRGDLSYPRNLLTASEDNDRIARRQRIRICDP